jgi:hypothetical protein
VQIRRGPRHCKRGGPKQQYATGAHPLGRQLRSKETRARRPIKFSSMRVDLGREVDDDSRNPSKSVRPRYTPCNTTRCARPIRPYTPQSVFVSLNGGINRGSHQYKAVAQVRKHAIPLARCTGSAVKIRHCPATVSDAFAIAYATAPEKVGRRNRMSTTSRVRRPVTPSSERKLTVRSF